LTLVAPVFNELDNLRRLHQRVSEIFGSTTDWELLLVDDGSKDGSTALIGELTAEDPRVVGVFFERNCGQTAAIAAGIHLARGRLIATLDADMQNDPVDLPAMIALLPGHDAVVGLLNRLGQQRRIAEVAGRCRRRRDLRQCEPGVGGRIGPAGAAEQDLLE
jgi:glycosyltransferase involved in cell wall biosynthesis